MNFITKFKVVLGITLFLVDCTTTDVKRKPTSDSIATMVTSPLWQNQTPPVWTYDGGPDPTTKMGRELIDLNSRIPSFPQISTSVLGYQKFRQNFGPIPWRMLQCQNCVKILFIGQDGTHIAEAAERPATAGFGGRAQDLAKYFGVGYSAAFINTYAFTIRNQYGVPDAPVIQNVNGTPNVTYNSFVDNQLWLMSQDLASPIVQWRNQLIDWIIRNNKDSLKMIVLFGGAARDAAGAYITSKGATVGSRFSAADLANIQVPEFNLTGSGVNAESAVPVAKDGSDFYAKLLGHTPNYVPTQAESDSDQPAADMMAAHNALSSAIASDFLNTTSQLVLGKGISGSGILNPAQLGGYDVGHKIQINGQNSISLKGLKIDDNLTIDHDLIVVQLPHPTFLTRLSQQPGGTKLVVDAVSKALTDVNAYKAKGWTIDPDVGFTNNYALGTPFEYGRSTMGPEYYDFGAPASRMVAVSTASRLNAGAIIFGTRDKATFDPATIQSMAAALPSKFPDDKEMWTTRPRGENTRYTFDSGPGETYARIMKQNLPADLVNSHSVNRDFAHYRGTFKNPRVVILADPDGYDDLITARALTGTRGQYLQGLMNDLGVNENYLVIKTAPFSLDRSNMADWKDIVAKTKGYRDAIFNQLLAHNKPEMIIADGPSAGHEALRIFGKKPQIPIVYMTRQSGDGKFGISISLKQIQKISGFEKAAANLKMADIPRSHMSYYARWWEGTSGDRVITSSDPQYAGSAFAEVAPAWAYNQNLAPTQSDKDGQQNLINKEIASGVRKGGEAVGDFLNRISASQK